MAPLYVCVCPYPVRQFPCPSQGPIGRRAGHGSRRRAYPVLAVNVGSFVQQHLDRLLVSLNYRLVESGPSLLQEHREEGAVRHVPGSQKQPLLPSRHATLMAAQETPSLDRDERTAGSLT